MAVPIKQTESRFNIKKEEKIISVILFSNLATGARRSPISASVFLLIGGADEHQLYDSTCLKEAQWTKKNDNR